MDTQFNSHPEPTGSTPTDQSTMGMSDSNSYLYMGVVGGVLRTTIII